MGFIGEIEKAEKIITPIYAGSPTAYGGAPSRRGPLILDRENLLPDKQFLPALQGSLREGAPARRRVRENADK